MVQINFARKEINCKIVYYGPGLSGKTTNLEMVHLRTPEANKGDLTSISTDGDRTLFFDFMPLDLGEVAGMKTKFHLYTVPGQVYYNSTRKLVLLGVDGVIFIADSDPSRLEDNIQSLENLRENLAEMGRDLTKIPLVIQYNKRDLKNAMTVDDLEKSLNKIGVPSFEASAKTGEGVFQTLKAISGLVLENINSTERKRPNSVEEKPAGAAKERAEKDRHAHEQKHEREKPEREKAEHETTAKHRAAHDEAFEDIPPAEGQPEPAVRAAPKHERRTAEVLRSAREKPQPVVERDDAMDQEAEAEDEVAVQTTRAATAAPAKKRQQQQTAPQARRIASRPQAVAAQQHAAKPAATNAHAHAQSKPSSNWLLYLLVLLGIGGAAAAFAVYRFLLH